MSTPSSATSTDPCLLLPWDCEFFGFTVAKVVADTMDEPGAAEVDRWCRERRVRLLYFLARSDHLETMRAAEQAGFYLTDLRITFDRQPATTENRKSAIVRHADPADIPALQDIAASAHSDTRFYFDEHIPRERCEGLYRHWIKASCQGYAQAVLTSGPVGAPTAYVTCHAKPESKEGSIGLVGVKKDAQGAGLGGKLVSGALDWFAAQGLPVVTVVTQGRNVAAQRLYQRCGFVTRSLQLYYHRWYGQ